MKAADINEGGRYFVAPRGPNRRGGYVDLLQSTTVAEVLKVGPEVHDEFLFAQKARTIPSASYAFREKIKRTVKVRIIKGEGTRTEPVDALSGIYVRDDDVIYLPPQHVLISEEEGLRQKRERGEARHQAEQVRRERQRENEALATDLNLLQLEAGLTTTDFDGDTKPLVEFGVDQNGYLDGGYRTSPDVLERLVREATKKTPTTEEVSA